MIAQPIKSVIKNQNPPYTSVSNAFYLVLLVTVLLGVILSLAYPDHKTSKEDEAGLAQVRHCSLVPPLHEGPPPIRDQLHKGSPPIKDHVMRAHHHEGPPFIRGHLHKGPPPIKDHLSQGAISIRGHLS